MADADLRGLERRWRFAGRTGEGAAFLVARLRAGELSPSALTLAAFLGHAPALEACQGLELPVPAERDADFDRWLGVLAEWGLPVAVRCALAVAGVTFERAGIVDPRALGLVDALRTWVDGPSLHAYARVRARLRACEEEPAWAPQPTSEAIAVGTALSAGRAVVDDHVFWATGVTWIVWTWPDPGWPREVRAGELREVVRAALLSWGLDRRSACAPSRDPLAAQVQGGTLGGERVVLAAYLGVEAALEALGPEAPAREPDPVAWAEGLVQGSGSTLRRVAWAVGALVLPACELRERSVLPARAVKRLRTLCEARSERANRRALDCLEGLLRLARRAPPSARPWVQVFVHALTIPWFVDPFPWEEDDDTEDLILRSWSGETGVQLDAEAWYLRVQGCDGSPVARVEYQGVADLTQEQALRRALASLVRAVLQVGVSAEALRARIRDEVGGWALSEASRGELVAFNRR